MKHNEMVRWIITAGREFVPSLTEAQSDALATHVQLVLARHKDLNLTAITDHLDALNLHVLDSLAAAPAVNKAIAGRLADIGSGAGFPGIPLAIVTQRPTTLVESVRKKATFLQEAVEVLRVPIEVQPVRAEELATESPESFAVVTARALSSLPSLVELASPLLCTGGSLLALKGHLDTSELERADKIAHIVGMRAAGVERVHVPGCDERHVLTYVKVEAPERSLPRRPGMAQKRPLA